MQIPSDVLQTLRYASHPAFWETLADHWRQFQRFQQEAAEQWRLGEAVEAERAEQRAEKRRKLALEMAASYLRAMQTVLPQLPQPLRDRLPRDGEWDRVDPGLAARACQDALAELEGCQPTGVKLPAPQLAPPVSARKRASREKIIAALAKHHQYDNGSVLNQEPIRVRELAELAKVSPSTVTEFFQAEFAGHDAYKRCCRDKSKLIAALKLLLQEFSPRLLLSPQALNSISVEDNPGGDSLDEN